MSGLWIGVPSESGQERGSCSEARGSRRNARSGEGCSDLCHGGERGGVVRAGNRAGPGGHDFGAARWGGGWGPDPAFAQASVEESLEVALAKSREASQVVGELSKQLTETRRELVRQIKTVKAAGDELQSCEREAAAAAGTTHELERAVPKDLRGPGSLQRALEAHRRSLRELTTAFENARKRSGAASEIWPRLIKPWRVRADA